LTRVALPVVKIAQITPPPLSLVQLGADTAAVAIFAKALQEAPLYKDQANPPAVFRATHKTCPANTSAQLGAE
jgi:hypothetical protein